MDPSKAIVNGKENICFEMELKAKNDDYDDVGNTYDEVGQASPPPVPKPTSCETCMHDTKSIRQALAEIENVCRSNKVVVRRMWFILAATVAVFLTAVATLVLVIMVMNPRGSVGTAAGTETNGTATPGTATPGTAAGTETNGMATPSTAAGKGKL